MSNIKEFNFLSVKGSPIKPESIPEELQKRLSLYQIFVKLYEHHGNLLEEILKLENLSEYLPKVAQPFYLQAFVDGDVVYVSTNLLNGQSQILRQSQNTWTIGRDRNSGIHIDSKYVSRRHAAIRYIDKEFYLIDLNSTNGTYINGEQIYQATKLEDQNIIRVGNITFYFSINQSCSTLPTVAVELFMQLVPKTGNDGLGRDREKRLDYYKSKTKTRKLENRVFSNNDSLVDEIARIKTFEEQLSQDWKSDILDRFYDKQALKNSV